MKLVEMNYEDWTMSGISRLLRFLNDTVERCNGQPVRVEIHSLDDKPAWSTERPKGWGVGCWCKWVGGIGIVIHVFRPLGVEGFEILDLSDNTKEWVTAVEITAYGPRVEVVE